MKRPFLIAFLCVAGCRHSATIPQTPTYNLLIPQGREQWKHEIRSGFLACAAQFNMTASITECDGSDALAISSATAKITDSKGAPVCVVFTQDQAVVPVVERLRTKRMLSITIGEDDANSMREGHCGDAPSTMAYLWSVRFAQMNPRPKRVLLLIGDVPLNKAGITSALYKRSANWTVFALRTKNLGEASAEDYEWADLVTPVGEDAVAAALTNTRDKAIFPVDSSQVTLSAVQSGRITNAFAPNYFQMGYRAARIARERFIQGDIVNNSIAIPYREIDKSLLPGYMRSRYDVPAAVSRVGG
jgi:hypothetical protein